MDKIFLALSTFWCIAWPVLLTWASVHGHPVLTAICVSVVAGTPIVAGLTMRRKWHQERAQHYRCHVAFEAAIDDMGTTSLFHMYEAAACELDLLTRALGDIPHDAWIDPVSLISSIEERADHLRKVAPVPESLPIQALLAEGSESSPRRDTVSR